MYGDTFPRRGVGEGGGGGGGSSGGGGGEIWMKKKISLETICGGDEFVM